MLIEGIAKYEVFQTVKNYAIVELIVNTLGSIPRESDFLLCNNNKVLLYNNCYVLLRSQEITNSNAKIFSLEKLKSYSAFPFAITTFDSVYHCTNVTIRFNKYTFEFNQQSKNKQTVIKELELNSGFITTINNVLHLSNDNIMLSKMENMHSLYVIKCTDGELVVDYKVLIKNVKSNGNRMNEQQHLCLNTNFTTGVHPNYTSDSKYTSEPSVKDQTTSKYTSEPSVKYSADSKYTYDPSIKYTSDFKYTSNPSFKDTADFKYTSDPIFKDTADFKYTSNPSFKDTADFKYTSDPIFKDTADFKYTSNPSFKETPDSDNTKKINNTPNENIKKIVYENFNSNGYAVLAKAYVKNLHINEYNFIRHGILKNNETFYFTLIKTESTVTVILSRKLFDFLPLFNIIVTSEHCSSNCLDCEYEANITENLNIIEEEYDSSEKMTVNKQKQNIHKVKNDFPEKTIDYAFAHLQENEKYLNNNYVKAVCSDNKDVINSLRKTEDKQGLNNNYIKTIDKQELNNNYIKTEDNDYKVSSIVLPCATLPKDKSTKQIKKSLVTRAPNNELLHNIGGSDNSGWNYNIFSVDVNSNSYVQSNWDKSIGKNNLINNRENLSKNVCLTEESVKNTLKDTEDSTATSKSINNNTIFKPKSLSKDTTDNNTSSLNNTLPSNSSDIPIHIKILLQSLLNIPDLNNVNGNITISINQCKNILIKYKVPKLNFTPLLNLIEKGNTIQIEAVSKLYNVFWFIKSVEEQISPFNFPGLIAFPLLPEMRYLLNGPYPSLFSYQTKISKILNYKIQKEDLCDGCNFDYWEKLLNKLSNRINNVSVGYKWRALSMARYYRRSFKNNKGHQCNKITSRSTSSEAPSLTRHSFYINNAGDLDNDNCNSNTFDRCIKQCKSPSLIDDFYTTKSRNNTSVSVIKELYFATLLKTKERINEFPLKFRSKNFLEEVFLNEPYCYSSTYNYDIVTHSVTFLGNGRFNQRDSLSVFMMTYKGNINLLKLFHCRYTDLQVLCRRACFQKDIEIILLIINKVKKKEFVLTRTNFSFISNRRVLFYYRHCVVKTKYKIVDILKCIENEPSLLSIPKDYVIDKTQKKSHYNCLRNKDSQHLKKQGGKQSGDVDLAESSAKIQEITTNEKYKKAQIKSSDTSSCNILSCSINTASTTCNSIIDIDALVLCTAEQGLYSNPLENDRLSIFVDKEEATASTNSPVCNNKKNITTCSGGLCLINPTTKQSEMQIQFAEQKNSMLFTDENYPFIDLKSQYKNTENQSTYKKEYITQKIKLNRTKNSSFFLYKGSIHQLLKAKDVFACLANGYVTDRVVGSVYAHLTNGKLPLPDEAQCASNPTVSDFTVFL